MPIPLPRSPHNHHLFLLLLLLLLLLLNIAVLYGRSEYFAKLLTSGFKEGVEAGGEAQVSMTDPVVEKDDDSVGSSFSSGRKGSQEDCWSFTGGTLPTVHIEDISAAAFAAVVEFMYSDQCSPYRLQGQLLLEVRRGELVDWTGVTLDGVVVEKGRQRL